MAPPSLLGPPQLRRSNVPTTQPEPASGDAFIDSLVADFNSLHKPTTPKPPMGFRENNSATYLSSGNPCFDHLFHVVPDTPSSYLHQQLPLAWAHDALTTLKLICNLRGVHGAGKSNKGGFYTAALWLHSHHPKTLACNVACFAEFGYFKDLSEILYRLLQGQDARKNQKSEWEQRKHSIARRPSMRSAKSTRTGLGVNRQEPKEPLALKFRLRDQSLWVGCVRLPGGLRHEFIDDNVEGDEVVCVEDEK
ncbi:hypothetical protein ACLB2K_053123 [Fragaria x ananassa]